MAVAPTARAAAASESFLNIVISLDLQSGGGGMIPVVVEKLLPDSV
ncbi:hypothetical protein [Sphingomonas pseudosanguinis]|uniref:Uncharacterized protein n=1 Tax=Sphingomonas pseudosanguinis TaxID=413712 RepID=A0A7W6F2E0_9SPHN|nr:hypothetical protein [Sphingomonas pseudosanguinis]MBB3878325.1 hypothetical protein [Sphingomonas pseudosanguinis]MBN3538194.1 hypothetical protein [Sphingomonas pseudosanguinis]